MRFERRIISGAELCSRLAHEVPAGSRVLKVDAWNEAYGLPHPGGVVPYLGHADVTVVEQSEEVANLAVRRGMEAKICIASVCDMPFRDAEFDVAVVCNSFIDSDAETSEAAVAELKRVAKTVVEAVPVDGECIPVAYRDGRTELLPWPIASLKFQSGECVFHAQQRFGSDGVGCDVLDSGRAGVGRPSADSPVDRQAAGDHEQDQ